ncbi:type II secretion system protein K [Geobacter sp. OR-1]|uniref:type II secretion system minor pseudopilin GspK n=1 Tax=Geobacter sp. OR-1 TaxID=1266765 RepID=UPI000542E039|nr:type II secretion system minor pseudopilin GspK [Geobacter sp. OR-1]GAM08760.1 type II secretion system protein K [Geobacter sp. OR-1]
MRGEKGFALVITLLVTALLVALTAEFTAEIFMDTSSRHSFVAGQQASLLAESGITGGVTLLQLTLRNQQYSSLSDPWATPQKLSDERGELRLVIEDESGKVNINYVAPPNGELEGRFMAGVAERLIRSLKIDGSGDLIDSLADWIDLNDYPHPGGAESPYYGALPTPYAVKNRPLDTVEELALVKGFAGKPLEALRPYITVYPENPSAPAAPININTASKEVIAALSEQITADLAGRVLEYRSSTPFKNPADLAKVSGFEAIATGLLTNISVKGYVYRIRSEGRVQDVSRTIEAVVRLVGVTPQFLYWREY